MRNTAQLEDKNTGFGLGIVVLLAVVVFALTRKAKPVSAAVAANAGDVREQAISTMERALSGEEGEFVTPEMRIMYETAARRAVNALDHPETPAGLLAMAIAREETGRGMPLEPASIGEQITATATGGVSIVRPTVADKLVELGAEAVYYSTQSGQYVNIYKDGQLVAKVTSPDYVNEIGAQQASAPATQVAYTAMQASIAEAIAQSNQIAQQMNVPYYRDEYGFWHPI